MDSSSSALNEQYLPFSGIDTSIILSLLQSIPTDQCINGKCFWKTYSKWEVLTVEQRNKAMVFWEKNITEATRQCMIDESRKKKSQEQVEENNRQVMTTKHDKARILHLRTDVSLSADWTRALREKSRAQLDTKEDSIDPWNNLAEKFNNYETYNYENACIIPNQLNSAGCFISVPRMQAIANICHDINPSISTRPYRDGGWLRNQYRELKGKISLCYNNYNRSGNQCEENEYDEWVKFSTGFSNDVVTYSRAIMNNELMDQLGRALPTEFQRDTDLLEPENTYELRKEKAATRKRQREAQDICKKILL